jgi:hypothetical protein
MASTINSGKTMSTKGANNAPASSPTVNIIKATHTNATALKQYFFYFISSPPAIKSPSTSFYVPTCSFADTYLYQRESKLISLF